MIIAVQEEDNSIVIHGCTSPDSAKMPEFACPFLGTDEIPPDILGCGIKHAFLVIGDKRIRFQGMRAVMELGSGLVREVSRRAVVSPRAEIGRGAAIVPGAKVIDAID